ncbi:DUF4189 domain-containing protein [Mycobacterium spongiae]|uniref:DUF4189 domain-containing protein n=1 Tax=Mycobacterium spongiae TaxID=886343 RepID=UPI001FE85B90|nr:DUF4189 domain-containing protein [Mycobacterium spongiae]
MVLVVAALVASAAVIITLLHPFDAPTHDAVAHSGKGSIAAARPVPPVPPKPPIYGAIAVAETGAAGQSWGYRTRALAETEALRQCNHDTCRVFSVFTKCGAIAHDGTHYHGGVGRSRQAAELDATTRLGGGWIVTWVCH